MGKTCLLYTWLASPTKVCGTTWLSKAHTKKRVMKATTSTAASSTPAHNAPLPPTNSTASRSSRIAPHSHIKGLGLNNEGYASSSVAGFVGQTDAREVCILYTHSAQSYKLNLEMLSFRLVVSSLSSSSRVNSLVGRCCSSGHLDQEKQPWLWLLLRI